MWGGHWAARGLSVEVLANSYRRFDSFKDDNIALDLGTKTVALRASSFVVSLICHAGEKLLSIGSGTIIECNADSGTFHAIILTSAILLRCPSGSSAIPCDLKIDVYLSCDEVFQGQVLAFDFHYGVATVEIKSTVPLSTATIRSVDDSLAIIHQPTGDELKDSASFQLRPHQDPVPAADRFNLRPGELVIALGRYFRAPYSVMAAPGVLLRDEDITGFDCKELFATSCTITKVGVGGPLINCHGEVIGLNFFAYERTVFLPINIVLKCLKNFKRNRLVPRPWLGVSVANVYTTKLDTLEKLKRNFPNIVNGVIVEEVKDESPARAAGLCAGDVIIKCGKISVGTRLEFIEALWGREGKRVKMVVVRPSSGEQFKLSVTVQRSPTENEWPALAASKLPTVIS